MGLIEAKIISMVVLGAVSILLGLIPLVIVSRFGFSSEDITWTTNTVLSGILCFGGGVLMGTGFIHLLPEVSRGFECYQQSHQIDTGNLPVGVVVICGGFFLVYFIEELVHFISDRHAHNETDVSLHRTVGIRSCPVSLSSEPSAPCDSVQPVQVTGTQDTACCYGTFLNNRSVVQHDGSHSTTCVVDMKAKETCFNTPRIVQRPPLVDTLSTPLPVALPAPMLHNHHMLVVDNDQCVGAALRGLLVIMALSFHEILEGLAIGLQKEVNGVWQLFMAVASHKYVISLCIGMELSTSRVSLLIYTIYILVFSLVTPFGIGIGILLASINDSDSTQESLLTLILTGLACGTILYVAFFEILERERSKATVGLFQWSLLLLGFLLMLGLEVAVQHKDEDSIQEDSSFDQLSTMSSFINATESIGSQ